MKIVYYLEVINKCLLKIRISTFFTSVEVLDCLTKNIFKTRQICFLTQRYQILKNNDFRHTVLILIIFSLQVSQWLIVILPNISLFYYISSTHCSFFLHLPFISFQSCTKLTLYKISKPWNLQTGPWNGKILDRTGNKWGALLIIFRRGFCSLLNISVEKLGDMREVLMRFQGSGGLRMQERRI